MFKVMSKVIALVGLSLIMVMPVNWLNANDIYTHFEYFENSIYRSADTNIDWNTNMKRLSLAPNSVGKTKQSNGSVALGSDNNLFVAWLDFRDGLSDGGHVYLQKYDRSGTKIWTNDIKVDNAGNPNIKDSVFNALVRTMAIGDYIYVYWAFDYNLYIQKFDLNGTKQWTSDFKISGQVYTVRCDIPAVVNPSTDEITFFWYQTGGVYMQKFNPADTGSLVGASTKVVDASQYDIAVGIDSSGNYYLTYISFNENLHLYLIKLTSAGAPVWSQPTLIAEPVYHYSNDLVIAANGDCYVIYDSQLNSSKDLQMCKVNTNGTISWTNQVRVNSGTINDPYNARGGDIKIGSNGNIYVLWQDHRVTSNEDLYVKSFNSDGAVLSSEQKVNRGINLENYLGYTGSEANFVLDSSNDLFVAWYANRDEDFNVYLQRTDSAGMATWTVDGLITQENAGGSYVITGTNQAVSNNINVSTNTIVSAAIYADNYTPSGTSYELYLSNNGGADWVEVSNSMNSTDPISLTFSTVGADLRWRVVLNSNNAFITPTISNLWIIYSINGSAEFHKYLYIYDDYWHYPASGFMASDNNIKGLKVNGSCPINPAQGQSCTEVTIDSNIAYWAGFFTQAKGKWRPDITDIPKGIDLSKYSALSFKARYETDTPDIVPPVPNPGSGGVVTNPDGSISISGSISIIIPGIKILTFGVGEEGDSCVETINVGKYCTNAQDLGTEWKTFYIDLNNRDLTDINGLFMTAIVTNLDGNVKYYIDDIKFIGSGTASITDLVGTVGPTIGSVNLSWTAPSGNRANTGYILKYSTTYFNNQSGFNSATTYTDSTSWIPAAPGTTETKTITGLVPGQTYYFAIETTDESGDQSDLSNILYIVARANGIGINVDGDIDLGEMRTGETKSSSNPIVVKNIGGVPVTLSLRVINPPGWYAGTNNSVADQYIIMGAFATAVTQVSWDIGNHSISDVAAICTSTRFVGDLTGVSVPLDGIRPLWINFTAPSSISMGTSTQTIRLIITGTTAN